EAWIAQQIAHHGAIALAAEPAQAVAHVGEEALARLLAVVDDVDPRGALALHHLPGRRVDQAGELTGIHRRPPALAYERPRQRRRSREAAGVGGEDAFVAPSHGIP